MSLFNIKKYLLLSNYGHILNIVLNLFLLNFDFAFVFKTNYNTRPLNALMCVICLCQLMLYTLVLCVDYSYVYFLICLNQSFYINFILFHVLWFPLNIMENSMDVKIFFENKLIPLILCVKDVIFMV
jgi:hypothetical protein